MIKRVAILTSGGDAPGMNAAVRCCIRAGLYNGLNMYVVYNGFKGLVEGNIHQVNKEFTQDIMNRGGTIIGSARLPEFKEIEVQKKALQQLEDYEIDVLIGIGGDGTFRGLRDLAALGFKCIGIPGTIDNDVASTDYTIGFMTSLNTICDCVDKLKDTSSSHQRCSVVEVMGRHCGDLAIFSGIAESAEMTISHDHPIKDAKLFSTLRRLKAQKKNHAIVIVSEKLLDVHELGKRIQEETGFDTQVEVLGHLQRGGSPCAYDRILASRMGAKAIEIALDEKDERNGVIIGMKHGDIVDFEINDALSMKRDAHKDLIGLIDMLQ